MNVYVIEGHDSDNGAHWICAGYGCGAFMEREKAIKIIRQWEKEQREDTEGEKYSGAMRWTIVQMKVIT